MTPSLPDHPPALDRDALIEAIYALQATMAMYVELLVRQRDPVIHPATIGTLQYINDLIRDGQRFSVH